ncbi:MAG: hypothetical protein ACUVXA_02730 [Candidatus Jordarchaeum sp.]|uniref:hypothetical protein n=1 Tax=Candidatus Jordarchaeum sp. TaxID=2823881 RepID=UPI00404B8E5A
MMDQNELSKLSILFEIGFLSDKIVKSIYSSKFKSFPLDEEVLKEALKLLKMVKKSKENFPPRVVEEGIIKNLIIHRLALFALSNFDEKTFTTEISTMIKVLESMIIKNNINEKDLNLIINFFSRIGRKTLEESNKYFKTFEYLKECVDARKAIEFEIEKILSQKRVLSRLQSEEFPTDAQEKAINLLLKTSSILYRALISMLEELEFINELPLESREQSSRMIETITERYSYLISFICKIIEFIEASSIRHFPPSTSYILENVIKKFQGDVHLIVSLKGENIFSYINLLATLKVILKNALDKEEMKNLDEDSPQHILLFLLPLLGKENILLNCLIANQIGNYIVEHNKIFPDIIKNEILSNFYKIPQPNNILKFRENELESVLNVEQALESIKFWIIIIASDLLAIHMFGPSYLFAFSKYIFHANTLRLRVPLKTRLKIMLEEIKKSNYIKNEEIRKEIEKLEEYAKYETSGIEKKLLDLIPKLKMKIENLTKGKKYSIQIFEEEVPFLVSSLLNFIPPNEILDFKNKISRPARIISILNAGWILKLTQIDNVYQLLNAKTREEKSQVDIKLNSLIQKSIELSEIHRKMKGD